MITPTPILFQDPTSEPCRAVHWFCLEAEIAVDLDSVQAAGTRCECDRHCAAAGADLHHPFARRGRGAKAPPAITHESFITSMKAVGELSVFRIMTKEVITASEHWFGEFGRNLTITVLDDYRGFLLAILPPGAFIGLGLLIAMMNFINARRAERAAQVTVAAPRPAEA